MSDDEPGDPLGPRPALTSTPAPSPRPPAAPSPSAPPSELRGIALFIGAIFLFSVMDIAAKHLTQTHSPMQVVWARYLSQTVWAFVLLAPRVRRLMRTQALGLQVLRSALLFGATFCFFTAISLMPLAEAIAIFEIAPLILTALAFFVLHEPVGPRRWTGVAIGFVGAMVIIRPGADVFSWSALLPMGAAACYAGYSIATRFLGDRESPWTSFLYTALFGSVAASVLAPFHWTTPSQSDAMLMATFGLIGGAGHLCLILALQASSASLLAPFNYVGLVFGTFWGLAIFAETPDSWTMAGALIIVGAGLYVWWRERVRATIPDAPAR